VCFQASSRSKALTHARTRSQKAATRAPPEATNATSTSSNAGHDGAHEEAHPPAPPEATNTTSIMYYAPIDCGLRVELLIIDKSLSIAQEDLYMYWHCEVSVSLGFTKVRDSLRTGFRDGCVSLS
jgi:hypothetical protein